MPADEPKTVHPLLLDKNMRWIGALEKAMAELPIKQQKEVMSRAGRDCAADILALCEKSLGHAIASIADLLRGWNLLRASRDLHGDWMLEGNIVRGVFKECGCPLVRSGLVQLHPARCLCSQNMMETIFSKVAGRTVSVEILQAIGRGDAVCEFFVVF